MYIHCGQSKPDLLFFLLSPALFPKDSCAVPWCIVKLMSESAAHVRLLNGCSQNISLYIYIDTTICTWKPKAITEYEKTGDRKLGLALELKI